MEDAPEETPLFHSKFFPGPAEQYHLENPNIKPCRTAESGWRSFSQQLLHKAASPKAGCSGLCSLKF